MAVQQLPEHLAMPAALSSKEAGKVFQAVAKLLGLGAFLLSSILGSLFSDSRSLRG